MSRCRPSSSLARGFTLIELLVVIGIIAVLASMLLPAMFAVSASTKVSNAESLLRRIAVALDTYHRSFAHYPPDYIPGGASIINFQGTKTGDPPMYTGIPLTWDGPDADTDPDPAYPPEALYYYLCHRFLTKEHPMLRLRANVEVTDVNGNGLPEVVDPWGRPILYNRAAFPACAANEYNFAGNPRHNFDTYDLYCVGPDGQTGGDLLPFSAQTFAHFCATAMNADSDGEGDDDIRNWKK